jgi:hypothetical protein
MYFSALQRLNTPTNTKKPKQSYQKPNKQINTKLIFKVNPTKPSYDYLKERTAHLPHINQDK